MAFPVFAASEKGVLLYKNPACAKYLSNIYGSRNIKNKIFPEFPQESRAVRVLSGSAYSVAVAVKDGENFVFLFFSRLQCADGRLAADKILKEWGSELSDLLVGFKDMIDSKGYPAFGTRVDDEGLLSLLKEESGLWRREEYCVSSVLEPVFERLNESFETIGYGVSAEIDKNFPEYLSVQLSVSDFLFIFGKLLYLTMKFSGTRHVNIVLFSEIAYSRHVLRLETKTDLTELPQTQENNVALLKALMPEYAAEINLLDRTGLMKSSDFSVRNDALGVLTVTYEFSYSEPDWRHVHRMEAFTLPITVNIENMIRSILANFKDKDASC